MGLPPSSRQNRKARWLRRKKSTSAGSSGVGGEVNVQTGIRDSDATWVAPITDRIVGLAWIGTLSDTYVTLLLAEFRVNSRSRTRFLTTLSPQAGPSLLV